MFVSTVRWNTVVVGLSLSLLSHTHSLSLCVPLSLLCSSLSGILPSWKKCLPGLRRSRALRPPQVTPPRVPAPSRSRVVYRPNRGRRSIIFNCFFFSTKYGHRIIHREHRRRSVLPLRRLTRGEERRRATPATKTTPSGHHPASLRLWTSSTEPEAAAG